MGMLQESCARCGHAFSFHSRKAGKPCKAIGCHAGPNGFVCPGFEPKPDASEELREALSAAV